MKLFFRRPPKDPMEKRAYFEVYGDYLAMNQSLKKLCFGIVFINVLLLFLLKKAQEKPPLVIRVNEVGLAEPVKDVNASSGLTRPEVLNFVRLFMKFYLERNFYTWKDNLAEAGLMMSPEFRSRIARDTNFNQQIADVTSNKLTSTLQLSDVGVTRETKEVILLSVKGWRQIASFDDPRYRKVTIFEAEIALKKVPRAMDTPYGLLVDSYKESDFKSD